MRRRYQPDHDESWSEIPTVSCSVFQILVFADGMLSAIVSVVGQLHLLQNNGVTTLLSLIGVCTRVSFVSSRESRVAVFVVDVDNFFIL